MVAPLARFRLDGYTADDTAGNANGVVEPGETITLSVDVENFGGDAHNTVGTVAALTPGITMLGATFVIAMPTMPSAAAMRAYRAVAPQ